MRLFFNPSWLDGKIVEFVNYVAEGTLSPTALVEVEWWDLKDIEFMSDEEAATQLLGFIPTDSNIPDYTASRKTHNTPMASLYPLQLVVKLIKSPLLPPTAAHALVNTRAASLQLIDTVQPMLDWLRRGLKEAAPYINNLGAI